MTEIFGDEVDIAVTDRPKGEALVREQTRRRENLRNICEMFETARIRGGRPIPELSFDERCADDYSRLLGGPALP